MYSTIRAKWATLTARLTVCRVRPRIANFFIMTIYLHEENLHLDICPVRVYQISVFSLHGRNVARALKKFFLNCTAIETEYEIYYIVNGKAYGI